MLQEPSGEGGKDCYLSSYQHRPLPDRSGLQSLGALKRETLNSSNIRDFITMSSSQLDRPVVSTDWLNKELKKSKGRLAVLDTTWFSDKDACSGFSK